jgi:hypothetical protein
LEWPEDLAEIVIPHQVYLDLDPDVLKPSLRMPILVDGRRVFSNLRLLAVGFIYRAVGRAAGQDVE